MSDLNLDNLDSQLWQATLAPHLDFTLHPTYKPADELLDEANKEFESFGVPFALRPPEQNSED